MEELLLEQFKEIVKKQEESEKVYYNFLDYVFNPIKSEYLKARNNLDALKFEWIKNNDCLWETRTKLIEAGIDENKLDDLL